MAKPTRRPPIPTVKYNMISISVESTKNKSVSYKNVGVAQFFPLCSFNDENLCNERVQYLMQTYKVSEEEAKKKRRRMKIYCRGARRLG
mmetsp:Transcript_30733/g.50223  ORF Transcript_30733/g.50223 Transcript_30733/m.50223 type:complete len:89 (-) Transcript_30733:85-351(-)